MNEHNTMLKITFLNKKSTRTELLQNSIPKSSCRPIQKLNFWISHRVACVKSRRECCWMRHLPLKKRNKKKKQLRSSSTRSNTSGPNVEPCGTPLVRFTVLLTDFCECRVQSYLERCRLACPR